MNVQSAPQEHGPISLQCLIDTEELFIPCGIIGLGFVKLLREVRYRPKVAILIQLSDGRPQLVVAAISVDLESFVVVWIIKKGICEHDGLYILEGLFMNGFPFELCLAYEIGQWFLMMRPSPSHVFIKVHCT